MKALKLLIFGLAIISLSCEKEYNTINSENTEFEKTFTTITNSAIGYVEGGEIKLGVSDEKIISIFKKFALSSKLEVTPEAYEIIEVNNNHYLRFYSKNNKASTIALLVDDNNKVITGSTVCTSDDCASCCGCVPDGQYCTECKPFGEQSQIRGDCQRITTGG